MALPVTIPNTFANATASIPLSQLDTNFNTLANAVNGISNGSETLANASVTVLTAGTVDINGGAIDGTTVGTSNAAAGSFTTLNTSGAVVFNDAGADVDFRVESDTIENALFVDGATGNIGIGTGSPSSFATNANNLVIGNGSGDNGLTIYSGNSSLDSGDIYFADGTTGSDTYAGYIIYQHDSDSLRFGTAATERARIDSSGNLLVGKTSNDVADAGAKLGTGGSNFTRSDAEVVYFNRTTSDGTIATFAKDGTAVGAIGTSGGELYIDFGGSTGGAVTSRTLDDYEEGTWTPTVAFGGASVGVTYSDQTGFYTKVGNLVYATCRIFLSSKGTSTGSFSVKSFPFTSVNIVSYRSGGSWAFWSGLATSYVEIAIYMQNNYNFVEFYGATAAATALSQISDTSIQNNTNIQFTIVYQAA